MQFFDTKAGTPYKYDADPEQIGPYGGQRGDPKTNSPSAIVALSSGG